ncbi:MAG: copper-translocating P-type ATPase [Magnetococcales bacterium]|nr:copper-translocating P-type ATPase [Magnetococcales bacterium]
MVTVPVTGMRCASCSGRLERTLSALDGFSAVSVNLATASASFDGPLPAAIAAIQGQGFQVPIQEITLGIGGLSCAACALKAETELATVPGVLHASVNLASGEAFLRTLAGQAPFPALRDAVARAGYHLHTPTNPTDTTDLVEEERTRDYRDLRLRLLVGLPLAAAIMGLMHLHMLGHDLLSPSRNHLLQALLATPIQFWVGSYFHKSAWQALRHGFANMHSLVSLGTFSAFGYSLVALIFPHLFTNPEVYFDSSAFIIVLVLVGRFLEARAKGRTSQAIRALMALTPPTARLIKPEGEIEVPAASVQVGEHLMVRPGERVPVDGEILDGHGELDESLLTGESLPVERQAGAQVIGGSINRSGAFVMRATRVGRDTTVAHLVRLVRQAQGAKPPIARLADRIAGIFVPAILILAGLTLLAWWIFGPQPAFTNGLLHAIAVLVIACPCALGLATPTSVMVGIGRGARHGILVRGGEALETLHTVSCVVFDKTGTLTTGKAQLVHWSGTAQQLSQVASAESRSEHLLARAVVAGARERGLTLIEATAFEALPGRGVVAMVNGETVVVGTRLLLTERGLPIGEHWEKALQEQEALGRTAMLAAAGDAILGVLAVADTLKEGARQAVSALRERGIEVMLLTGDNERTARALAKQAGIERVVAEVMPERKAEEVARLQAEGRVVAMVGDGINDAPALARADVGVALGTGAEVAMEAADITLMGGDPRGVVTAIDLSKATMRNIRQNLFWAFAYNVVLVPLAAGVLSPTVEVTPVMAAAAMGLSSVTVVSNALRLKIKPA